MRKKLFAVLICMFVVLTQLPLTALADEQLFTVTCENYDTNLGYVKVSKDNITWSESMEFSADETVYVRVDLYNGNKLDYISFTDSDDDDVELLSRQMTDNNFHLYIFDMPACDLFVNAGFIQPKYSVEIDSSFLDKDTKVTLNKALSLYTYDEKVTVSFNKPVPEGYSRKISFKNIYGANVLVEFSDYKDTSFSFSMPKQDIIIYIGEEKETYKTYLSLDGGIIEDNDLIEYDSQNNLFIRFTFETDTFDLPIPTKENCVFAGWFTSSDFNTLPVTKIQKGTAKNVNLYAKWVSEIPNSFSIITQTADSIYSPEGDAYFSVNTNASNLIYQWQYSNGSEWVNCEFTGYNTPNLTVPNSYENLGYYRCIVNDGYHYAVSDVSRYKTDTDTYSVSLDTSEAYYLKSIDLKTHLLNDEGLAVYVPGEMVFFEYSSYSNSGYKVKIEFLDSSGETLDVSSGIPEDYYETGYDRYFVMPDEDVIIKVSYVITELSATLNLKNGIITLNDLNLKDKIVIAFDVNSDTIELPVPTRDGYYFAGWFTSGSNLPVTAIEKGSFKNLKLNAEWIEEIPEEFHISKQPVSYIGKPNQTHYFSVKTDGGQDLIYQWQYNSGAGWTNFAFDGSKSSVLTLSTTSFYSNLKYRCVIYDGYHYVVSDEVGITISDEAKIISQPEDFSGLIGSYAEFSVKAKGVNLKYQWQYLNAKGVWKNSNSTGFDTPTMSVKITEARDGQKYRCIITQGEVAVTTDEAAIHAESAITIHAQPEDCSGAVGENARFYVEADGEDLKYQWQYQNAKGTWKNSNSAGSDSFSMEIKITATRDGQKYRCVITDKDNNKLVSDTAMIIVDKPASVITTQPVDFTGTVGATAVFSVETAEGDYSYQWQYSKDGITWKNSNSAGYNTASMSVKITEARAGQMYRCVIKGADIKETSEVAKIILAEPQQITISTQPQNYEGALGENAVFTVAAEGEGLTYQWQYSKDGATWRNSSSNGYNTASLSVEITEKRDGQQYRCVVSDGRTKVTSDAASVILVKQVEPVEPAIVITKQPEDCYVYEGEDAVFSVEATGADLNYSWEMVMDGKRTGLTPTDEVTSTHISSVTLKYDKAVVRCKITDKDDNYVYTEDAYIHIIRQVTQPDNPDNPVEPTSPYSSIVITKQPEDCYVKEGEDAVFSVEATGADLNYSWEMVMDGKLTGLTPTDEVASTHISSVTLKYDNAVVRCRITDRYGSSVYTFDANIHVTKNENGQGSQPDNQEQGGGQGTQPVNPGSEIVAPVNPVTPVEPVISPK